MVRFPESFEVSVSTHGFKSLERCRRPHPLALDPKRNRLCGGARHVPPGKHVEPALCGSLEDLPVKLGANSVGVRGRLVPQRYDTNLGLRAEGVPARTILGTVLCPPALVSMVVDFVMVRFGRWARVKDSHRGISVLAHRYHTTERWREGGPYGLGEGVRRGERSRLL